MEIISFNEAATANGRIEKFNANPDSNSGIVTVPKVIGAGESVTIPAGRVAVLPNVQVDGTLNIDGEVFVPSGSGISATEIDATTVKQNGNVVANDSAVVHKTGNETIAGVKTFTSSPIVPTPTTDMQATTKAYVDANAGISLATANSYDLGVGQTWQDRTASRVSGVTYTNSTGKPIMVLLAFSNAILVSIDAIPAFTANNEGLASATSNISLIIPSGSTYRFSSDYGITKWMELR